MKTSDTSEKRIWIRFSRSFVDGAELLGICDSISFSRPDEQHRLFEDRKISKFRFLTVPRSVVPGTGASEVTG